MLAEKIPEILKDEIGHSAAPQWKNWKDER
jgi:hypothetical protein